MSELMQKNNSIQNISITYKLFQNWINYVDVKPESVKTYTKAVTLFLKWLNENNIIQPTREDIIKYRDGLRDKKKINEKGEEVLMYQPSTIQNYIIAIRQFFKWLAQNGYYENIADNVKGAKISKGFKKDYLSSEQVKLVLSGVNRDTLIGSRDYALVSLMVTGGLRDIEVVRANIGDIRIVRENAVLHIQGKGEDEKGDYIKITPIVYEKIKKYLLLRYGDSSYKNTDALFASTSNNNYGKRMTTKSVNEIVKKCMGYAGLKSKKLTAHSLRHTAGTLNLIEGRRAGVVDILEQTRQLLRHSKIETTLIYAHHIEREENMSEQRIADAIFS